MDDLRLGPSFHVLVFVDNPHSSLHVLFPHKTFVKRQVMAYSVLLIQLSSSLSVNYKNDFRYATLKIQAFTLTHTGNEWSRKEHFGSKFFVF